MEALRAVVATEASTPWRVWHIRWLYVPRLPFVKGRVSGEVVPWPPRQFAYIPQGVLGSNISDRVVAGLAGQDPPLGPRPLPENWPADAAIALLPHWTRRELVQRRRLYIAARRVFVADHDPEDHRLPQHTDRDDAEASRMWASIGSWPWSMFGPEGKLPYDWRESDLAVGGLQWWLEGGLAD
jgi:hypothetical protein